MVATSPDARPDSIEPARSSVLDMQHPTIADELREDPLLAALRRPACVPAAQIRLAGRQRVREIERIPAPALVPDTEARELRLSAVVVVVQVHEERDDPLAASAD